MARLELISRVPVTREAVSTSHPVRSRFDGMSKAFSAPLRNVSVLPVAFLCCALAACGTVVPPPGAHPGTTKASSSPGSGTTPKQRAAADAAAILAAFVPPSGSVRLASAPFTGGAELLDPVFREDTPDQVNTHAWWHVPGQSPSSVLSWENAHLPRQFGQPGGGTSGPASFRMWNLPEVPGVLNERQLTMAAVSDGKGNADIRVDAHVDWIPARPGWAYVPATARAVIVTAVPGGNDRKKPPVPVTVTEPDRVRELVSLVNALPMAPVGVRACPADDGRGVRLTFLAAAGGPVLATAFATSRGCGGALLAIGAGPLSTDRPGPHRVSLGFGTDAAAKALAISGMNWRLLGGLTRRAGRGSAEHR
jgi:hypothetical protein